MAIGKPRNNKRSSSTSYASTISTVVFIALCVLGVWILTSNSIMPPQTTTRGTTTTTTTNTNTYSSSADTRVAKSNDRKDPPAFEDNPGELPDDAIKSDDPHGDEKSQEEQKSEFEIQKYSDGESSTGAANEADGNTDKQETEQENGGGDGKNGEENSQGKESGEEQEQQKESESQVSEESTLTLNQQGVHTNENENRGTTQQGSENEETKQTGDEERNVIQEVEESKSQEGESHENAQESQHQILDEDEQQRLQQQQKEEEKGDTQRGDQNEETQHENQQHQEIQEVTNKETQQNEGTEQSQTATEEQESTHATEETNTQAENQETQQESQQNESRSGQEATQGTTTTEEKATESNSVDSLPTGENSGIPKESKESKKSWSTQADQSENQKERRKDGSDGKDGSIYGYTWQLCNVTAGTDYIPCLDNEKALRKLRSTKHYEHRERHCPEEGPTCLVPVPEGYKRPIEWPKSREKIWYHNVPHPKLAEVKGHQNWVKVTGEFLTFPGGGTQFIHGALHYIDFIQQSVPDITWGKHTRVVLDVGCGVASFGGYLFDRDVLTMSFAPKDEHEAQVQFALERGIPAISAVMGSQRLPFPSRVFDLVHCARCRVPWHAEGGALLLELNRILRPGGYFAWSATPVYQKLEEDVEIWKAMSSLTASMCWELVTIKKDKLNSVGAALYRKPKSNNCYDQRKHNHPPMCKSDDDPNAAWYVPLQSCLHRVPADEAERGSEWPEDWPRRLKTPPYWLNSSQMGIYGKPAPDDFATDYEHWKRVINKSYLNGLGISWSNVRNVMDMRAVYGGFAAALKDLKVWVMNVVNVDSPDTLPIIYERGLFGIYHDWCESFSTYPRTYDLLHADHLFSRVKKRCKLAPLIAEIDRIVRPGGKLIVRDESGAVGEVENLLKSMRWEVHLTFSKDQEGILSAQKSDWRPDSYAASS
ncbi:hypothetical protein L1049_003484 [Liquidambar formosana]|uniref:Methyltransferase PMT27 n=1 Tax=Liquidambar formosana TaxID=63359 RepID=A0AAP0N2U7_LIQFO